MHINIAIDSPDTNYSHLALKDLLTARDMYHLHLMRHPNVVATAVGRYRIRRGDPWPNKRHPTTPINQKPRSEPRRLDNSEVRPYSWPAILVFVSKWLSPAAFRTNGDYEPDQMVPRVLYLPDGRRIPVCVIEAPKFDQTPAFAPEVRYPLNNIGGGFPVLAEVQGREYVATVGCLVTDGHKYYGITNRHVTGDPGELVYSRLGGKKQQIGVSSDKQITRLLFEDAYPGWPSRQMYVNIDVGLIDVDDVNRWTTDVRDVGSMGPLVDLSADNMTLALIGTPVRGAGAAGGVMHGEIQALFYRYKSRAGFEYVADLFIGPRTSAPQTGLTRVRPSSRHRKPFATFPGDSGTLWLVDPVDADAPKKKSRNRKKTPAERPVYRPLALQWGENIFEAGGGSAQPYVLATCLSTVCNRLGVELVRDWNVDQPDTWGAVGHFSIAARAIGALSSKVPKLSTLMTNNLLIISHDDDTILKSAFKGMGSQAFVPMADVPDFFWKHGKQGASRGLEGPNHFADMDQTRSSDGMDLLTLSKNDSNIDPTVWNAFYDSVTDLLTGKTISQMHRGLLPFRVWQIFDEMVDFASKGKTPEFVCAAGVLAHYVGDACQPLHISFLHDGDPMKPQTKTVTHKTGAVETVTEALGAGVHTAYEDDMVNAHRKDILDGLAKTPKVKKAELLDNGFEAAKATIALMRGTFTKIAPSDIVGAFIAFKGTKAQRAEAFWKQFGTKTVTCMQNGTHLIATLWESAWTKGGGESAGGSTAELTHKKAMGIVAKSSFLESFSIAKIGTHLTKHP